MKCKVCDSKSSLFGVATILRKHAIEYFRCPKCAFIQTEEPYWLDEAYESAIIDTDIGLIARNERFARLSSRLLKYVFPEAETAVDYGGGYGMMTRMMRDRGHDFRHFDPHCENLFAKGFETSPGEARFDLLTAFEVWEHMADPSLEVDRVQSMADHWLVSTHLVPDDAPGPGDWWYYALEGGQHVSLWSRQAMQVIADKHDRQYVPLAGGLHLFSRKPINARRVRWAVKKKAAVMLDLFRRREPLTQADYEAAKRRAA